VCVWPASKSQRLVERAIRRTRVAPPRHLANYSTALVAPHATTGSLPLLAGTSPLPRVGPAGGPVCGSRTGIRLGTAKLVVRKSNLRRRELVHLHVSCEPSRVLRAMNYHFELPFTCTIITHTGVMKNTRGVTMMIQPFPVLAVGCQRHCASGWRLICFTFKGKSEIYQSQAPHARIVTYRHPNGHR
jgi:hypothetical protein